MSQRTIKHGLGGCCGEWDSLVHDPICDDCSNRCYWLEKQRQKKSRLAGVFWFSYVFIVAPLLLYMLWCFVHG